MLPAHATPPSAEAQASLRKGFKAAAQGFLGPADELLSQSIKEWEQTKQPPDEIAALYKTRGGVRQQQGKPDAALTDLSESLRLIALPNSQPDPAEVQRTFVLRARVNEQLRRWRAQEADLSAAIARLDDLDAIEATNPFLYSSRASARAKLGDFAGAAEDAELAEVEYGLIGDKVRKVTAAADLALYRYGAGDLEGAVDKMRFTFKSKGLPASNNPDDIPLLQELSRKDAELHLAYAAHLLASARNRPMAETQWASGCIRLEAFVQDGMARRDEEAALQAADAERADASGKLARARASSVAAQPLGILTPNSDFNARLNGMDPQSPYVTQRPGTGFFWYKTGEGEIERRDPGNALAEVDLTLSCARFRSPEWLAENRPEWPPNLRAAAREYSEQVPQQPIVMPPKGGPPSRGEVEF